MPQPMSPPTAYEWIRCATRTHHADAVIRSEVQVWHDRNLLDVRRASDAIEASNTSCFIAAVSPVWMDASHCSIILTTTPNPENRVKTKKTPRASYT